ncbi:MAG: glycosyltransferase family 2 protein [Candidatus Eisenbacteria bacterium]|nr:glycosyltransferase family 2 protein [Candidatus Eisenbacteria bacterium]
MPKPSVIAIVVTWNGRRDTLECLESLRQSNYPRLQVILVDNGSTDGTPDAARESYPETIVIKNNENLLFSKGVNIGLSCGCEMGGDYFFLINSDATVHTDCVPNLVDSLEREHDTGLSGPKIFYAGTRTIWSAGGRVRLWAGMTSHIGIRQADSQKYSRKAFVDYLTACALMIRREVIGKVGMLDDRYSIYGEDADFSLRAREAGYTLLFVPEAIAWHKVSSSSGGGLTPFKAYNRGKSGIFLFRKYAKWYHFLTAPVFGLLGLVAFSLKNLTPGNARNVHALWKGVFSGIRAALKPGHGLKEDHETCHWWSSRNRF